MTPNPNAVKRLLRIIFLDQTSITLTFPVITLIFFDSHSRLFAPETSLVVRSFWFGLCVSLPNFLNIFFSPFLSALSDEFGRRPILLLEIASAFFFTLLVGSGIYFSSLPLLFIGFMIKGAFSRSNPTALAIISDTVNIEKKVLYMGYLQFAISIGAMLGPFLGGYLANPDSSLFVKLNFALPFFFAASIALVNSIYVYCKVEETLKKVDHKPWANFNFHNFKSVLLQPAVRTISFILILMQLSWSTYYQMMPPILKLHYNYDPQALGAFIGMIACWLAITTGIGIRFLNRYFQLSQLLIIANLLVLLGLFLNMSAFSLTEEKAIWVMNLAAAPIAFGDVLGYSCLTTYYSNTLPIHSQGKVMGIGLIMVGIAWSSTGFFGSMAMTISPFLPLVIAPIGVLLASVLLITKKLNLDQY